VLVADTDLFEGSILPRLASMLISAREHNLIIALNSMSLCAQALPGLHEIGINAFQYTGPHSNMMMELAATWNGRIAFIGGISSNLVAHSSKDEIDDHIGLVCAAFIRQPGFVLGLDASLPEKEDFSYQNYLSMVRAIQKYGRIV
jgi:hypothetical protein